MFIKFDNLLVFRCIDGLKRSYADLMRCHFAYNQILAVSSFSGASVIEEKHSYKIYYNAGNWGASLSALTKGDFIQSKFGTVNGRGYIVPEMTTQDIAVWAKFDLDGKDARVKYTIKNFEDERAPLADGYQGYFSDIHQDLGMIHQLELRVRF